MTFPQPLPLPFHLAQNRRRRVLYFTPVQGYHRCLQNDESRVQDLNLNRQQIAHLMSPFVHHQVPEANFLAFHITFLFEIAIGRQQISEVDCLCSFSREFESQISEYQFPAVFL
jgi:hypothetical protein